MTDHCREIYNNLSINKTKKATLNMIYNCEYMSI